mmetsp:Transcript_23402/g.23040  ORF Transcript_23402/g.23040 Transcript_23402/m.23040 type:complete len:97 (-) Transcript_23402:162-452(-)
MPDNFCDDCGEDEECWDSCKSEDHYQYEQDCRYECYEIECTDDDACGEECYMTNCDDDSWGDVCYDDCLFWCEEDGEKKPEKCADECFDQHCTDEC